MPKVKKDDSAERQRFISEIANKGVGRDVLSDKLKIAPATINKWVEEIIPTGSGKGLQHHYDDLSLGELERDIEHRGAVAKMYVIERIITLVSTEQDLSKVSGALRDLKSIATEAAGAQGGSGWNEYVMAAIRRANKKGPVHIENQQINISNGANEGKD